METKIVKIGNKVIGGGNPILIQSMTNTKTENVADTVAQINALTDLGCDIIRCAVPTMEAARALKEIKKQISIPLVADIHFDYKLAIAAIENGAKVHAAVRDDIRSVPFGSWHKECCDIWHHGWNTDGTVFCQLSDFFCRNAQMIKPLFCDLFSGTFFHWFLNIIARYIGK